MEIDARIKARTNPPVIRWVNPETVSSPFIAKGEWVNFEPGRYEGVDFSRSVFDPFNSHGALFERCLFNRVRMKTGSIGSGRIPTVFSECTFDRSDLHGAHLGLVRFERCLFDRAKIDGWWAFTAEFIDCTFKARLKDVRFAGGTEFAGVDVGRATNEFRGNDFTAAELIRVEFILGIDLTANRLPMRSEYALLDQSHLRIDRARSAIAQWEDDKAREAALLELRIYSETGYSNQDQLFIRRDELVPDDPATRRRLLELLEQPLVAPL